MNVRKWLIGLAVAVIIAAGGAYAFVSYMHLYASAPVFAPGGVAINGYDPVAYFTESAPVKGGAEHSTQWNGATWHFSSEDNLAAFTADPERYAPQFGGYCAYAVGNGYTARTDPDAWNIIDGRLYLNFDGGTSEKWFAEHAELIEAGDANWPGVLR